MAFFIGVHDSGRTTFHNLKNATSIVHDQTSVDRARWVFRFGTVMPTQIIVQRDSQQSAYNRITRYFIDHSSGV